MDLTLIRACSGHSDRRVTMEEHALKQKDTPFFIIHGTNANPTSLLRHGLVPRGRDGQAWVGTCSPKMMARVHVHFATAVPTPHVPEHVDQYEIFHPNPTIAVSLLGLGRLDAVSLGH